jgi:hypothetical protein
MAVTMAPALSEALHSRSMHGRGRGPHELAVLEFLRQHAQVDAVMPKQLDQPGAAAAERIVCYAYV